MSLHPLIPRASSACIYLEQGISRMSSLLNSLLLEGHSPDLCAAAGLGHTPALGSVLLAGISTGLSGRVHLRLARPGSAEWSWRLCGLLLAYLGWKGTLGRVICSPFSHQPDASSLLVFLCE